MNFKKNIMKSITVSILVFIISLSGISQLTYVPDDNFEYHIETYYPSASNGVVNDNYVNTSGLTAKQLSLANASRPISDLTGLQDFNLLEILHIQDMYVTSVDLSNIVLNPSINYPTFYNLDIINCPYLTSVIMPHNKIRFVISDCPYLNDVKFHNDNVLLSTAGTPGFGFVFSACNSLTSIDLSNVSDIEAGAKLLIQNNNNLKCINLKNGKCNRWNTATFNYNPLLTCIKVDDIAFCQNAGSIGTWAQAPTIVPYSTNCNCISGVNDLNETEFSISPNPTSSEVKITINLNQLGKSFTLFDNVGREKMRGVFNSTEYILNLESFEPGIYLLKTSEEETQFKIVKN